MFPQRIRFCGQHDTHPAALIQTLLQGCRHGETEPSAGRCGRHAPLATSDGEIGELMISVSTP